MYIKKLLEVGIRGEIVDFYTVIRKIDLQFLTYFQEGKNIQINFL